MYTVSEDRSRRTSAGQSSREFPVLFHLMDVSRPRANRQSPTIDSANLLNAVEQLRWPPADDIEPAVSATPASQPAIATVTTPVTLEITDFDPEPPTPE